MSHELIQAAHTAVVAANGGSEAANLTPAQTAALDALLAGKTASDAALAAGVARATLYKWLRQNALFQAAVNRGRRELQEAVGCRLEQLAADAAECMGKAIRDGNVKAATELLKAMRLLAPRPIGSDDAIELEIEMQKRHEKQQDQFVLSGLHRKLLK